ncbi:MAG: hypothetical protein JXA13_15355 [Anaerolineales bacterium]|nr:hypothetical protein [Anaerolineales bacterium]
MIIPLTTSLIFLTALTLLILQWIRPEFRYTWLVAAGGILLAWITTIIWQFHTPVIFELPSWKPAAMFPESPRFVIDAFSWPYAISLTTLALSVILTSATLEDYPNPLSWAGTLALIGFGLLAVLADNPLTLVMVWAAIDLVELVTQLRTVTGTQASRQVIFAFVSRMAGIGVLIWASLLSLANGSPLDFRSTPPQITIYLIIAAGLRLGVFPLHLPYPSESAIRRGFGTTLRLVSAASSMMLLSRIPPVSTNSPAIPYLMVLTALAAVYGGWMWFRSSNDLNGRPFWIIALAALSVASALQGNPAGSVSWGIALILVGGALFLSSIQERWLTRLLLAGAWGLSALPFSPTASGWSSHLTDYWWLSPFFVATQALLLSGYIRNVLYPFGNKIESQPIWARNIYPAGIVILVSIHILLGLWGWEGAQEPGNLIAGPLAFVSGLLIYRFGSRLRMIRNLHTTRPKGPTTSWSDTPYNFFQWMYHQACRLSLVFSNVLEGDGGILWALLFLAFFFSRMYLGTP